MIMNGHKKTRALSIICSKASGKARITIIEQQPAPLRYNNNPPIKMVGELIRNKRKHLLSIIPLCLKIFQIFRTRIIFVKCLQYVIDTVYREPLPATESVAKVKRFFESTRENAYNFPKYMGYRTKQHYLCNIFPDLEDKHDKADSSL